MSLKFFATGKRGTIRASPNYDPEKSCEIFYRSMKGLGTDEDAIIDVVAAHNFNQRQELRQVFRHKYAKDLMDELDGELSFSFAKIVLSLMKRPEEFIIDTIRNAITKSRAARILKQLQKMYKKGLGPDEYTLLALLCPRPSSEIAAIKTLYKKKYNSEIEDDIGFDMGEGFRNLIIEILNGTREDEAIPETVLEDAEALHGAGFVPQEEISGTKERILQQIFTTRSYDHIKQLLDAYQEVSEKKFEEYIESTSLHPDVKNAYLAIVSILRNEPEFYADRLREAIRGLGTDDETLISVIVLRCEVDLRDIMEVYETKYGVTLQEDVEGDTSGDYKNMVLKILNLPDASGSKVERQSSTVAEDVGGEEKLEQVQEEEGE